MLSIHKYIAIITIYVRKTNTYSKNFVYDMLIIVDLKEIVTYV